jgi:hypothetical protein
MKRIVLPLFMLIFPGINLIAQHEAYLDIGNVRALITTDLAFFRNKATGNADYEVPKWSKSHSIYSSSFWISAKEIRNGLPHFSFAHETFGFEGNFMVGPVDIVNQRGDTSKQFQRLWKINQSIINNHKLNWNSPSYTMPAIIRDWPGNGNANTAKRLAPFADLDNDSIYEPKDGEYPLIKGDQAIFLMANDYRTLSRDTVYEYFWNGSGPDSIAVATQSPLHMEMHLLVYGYGIQNLQFNATTFVDVTIYNRSNSPQGDLEGLKFSVFNDFDLGNPTDDYIGTDTSRNMSYVYNGDLFDDDFMGFNGYGSQLASQGVIFLSNALDHSVYFNLGVGANGDPTTSYHIANYQRGLWQNDQPIYYGGDGLRSSCVDTSKSVEYMFEGDPTLLNDTSQWTEQFTCTTGYNPNPPGDRRMISGPDIPARLNHGDHIAFTYAYIFARDQDSTRNLGEPVTELYKVADSIQAYYDRNLITSTQIPSATLNENNIELYPNPAKEQVYIKNLPPQAIIRLRDIKGQLLESSRDPQINTSTLANGIYFIEIESDKYRLTKKLIISH